VFFLEVDGVQYASTGCLVLGSRRNSMERIYSEHNIHQKDHGYFRENQTLKVNVSTEHEHNAI